MKHLTLTFIATLCVLSTTPAFALDSCKADADCKAASDFCHAGVCLPKVIQCVKDADCAGHKRCDMTCPHSDAGIAGSDVITVEPAPGTDDAPGSSSGSSSGSAGSGSSGSGGSSGADSSGGEGTSSSTEPTREFDCPKDVGVCVVALDKVKPSTACQSFCDVAAKCNAATTTGGTEPPSSGGAGALPGSGDDPDEGDDDGDSDVPGEPGVPTPMPGEGGSGDDKGTETVPETSIDTETCAVMCTVLELEKIGAAEMSAVSQCFVGAKDKTCEEIEKTCGAEMTALEKAVEAAEDQLTVALAGGFGGASSDNDSTSAGNTGGTAGQDGVSLEEDNKTSTPAQTAGTSDSSSGGCTAGRHANGSAGLMLLMVGLFALIMRRRSTTA